MKTLNTIIKGFELIKETIEILKNESFKNEFVKPFIVIDINNNINIIHLNKYSDEEIKNEIFNQIVHPECFILAGETEISNNKTGEIQNNYIIKLYINSMEYAYIYSIPLKTTNSNIKLMSDIKYAGAEINNIYNYQKPIGEQSSCNTIKMDATEEYNYRAAFLIGHLNEERLWLDTETVIADMYCKIGLDINRSFELIFEISKFGQMTNSMQTKYNEFNTYFYSNFRNIFTHIKGEIQLENTVL